MVYDLPRSITLGISCLSCGPHRVAEFVRRAEVGVWGRKVVTRPWVLSLAVWIVVCPPAGVPGCGVTGRPEVPRDEVELERCCCFFGPLVGTR